ncbi:WD40-repeat-containing domain protein [Xylaria acuta]|nr:WD40-repeat-containing domain protein [Xylaria acuta]
MWAELDTVLDLNHLINQICGEFATINRNGQLTLVHQTAREYLRTTDELGFTLEPSKVNKELLDTCLQSLGDLSPNKILQGKTSSFTSYSSASWSSHLDHCSAESDDVLDMPFNFFSSNLPASWIHVLAINTQVSTLVKASASLTTFVRKRQKANATGTSPLQRVPDLKLLENWAVDLLKITAMSGSYLNHCPETIHTCIPPLSPENSMIFQKFSKYPAVTLSILGPSNMDWDDCLARVWVAERSLHFAVSSQFLAMASQSEIGKDTIRLCDSIAFQERRKFPLDEPICVISFSQTGSLLACCGPDNTFVWNVTDGSTVCKLESPNRERAVTVEFAPAESLVLVATSRRRVYRLDLKKEHPSWTVYNSTLLDETFFSPPSSLAFNEDCTQLAIGYRGLPLTIWNLNPPKVVARCNRKKIQTRINEWISVKKAVWHPFNGQILGIYADGAISQWNPNDDTYVEVKDRPNIMPAEIRCSRSGTVFATSTVSGIVEIYDYSGMVLIHRLIAYDMTYSIAFSPDSLRLYDLRESYCNVWEPNCLLRIGEAGLSTDVKNTDSSDSEGTGNLPSGVVHEHNDMQDVPQSQLENQLAITAVAACRGNQQLCAYVKDISIVEVYDWRGDIQHTIDRSESGMGTHHVALSQNGDDIAYSKHSYNVHFKSLDLSSASGEVEVGTLCSGNRSFSGHEIRQLLFDTACKRILVCGRDKLEMIRMTDSSVVAEMDVESKEKPARWGNHPNIQMPFSHSLLAT